MAGPSPRLRSGTGARHSSVSAIGLHSSLPRPGGDQSWPGVFRPEERDPAIFETCVHYVQAAEHPETALLPVSLGHGGVTTELGSAFAYGDREPLLDTGDPRVEARALGFEIAQSETARILARAGGCPCPARWASGGQGPLTLPAGVLLALACEAALAAPLRQVLIRRESRGGCRRRW